MRSWAKEIRIAVRALRKKPGFVGTCILTLALGIGANTAIFSVINGAMLRPLPFPESDRLVFLSEWWRDATIPGGSSMNAANFADLRESVGAFEYMTPYTFFSANLSGGEAPERVRGLAVGHQFFTTLGVQPFLGRDFTRDDDVQDGPSVTVLTYELWRDRFGADPSLIGGTIQLDGSSYTVLGVLPEGTEYPTAPRLFVPLGFEGREHSRDGRQLNGVARLAAGATVESAQTEIMAAYARLEEAYPQNDNWGAWADPLQNLAVRRSQRDALGILGWSVALVFLIACLNLANLLLVRAETRQRELAVRVALGAGKARLVPRFLGEALILSLTGGAVGVLVAYWGVQGMKAAYGSMLPRPNEIALDSTVLGFAVALSVGAGLLTGIAPLLRADLTDLQKDLKDGARGVSGRGSVVRRSLVVGELALAVVLLATAGLLVRSFYRVASIDVGIEDPEEVLVAQLSLPTGRYEDRVSRAEFFRQMLDEVEALPGITAAGTTNRLPLYGGTNFTRVPVVGDPDRFANFVEWRVVTPGFFDAVGVRLEEGRMMGPVDMAADSVRTIMVTRELARQLFGEGSAVGHRIDVFGDDVGMEIIGVVSDLRDLGHETPAPPGVYAALSPASAQSSVILLARTTGDPMQSLPALRDLLGRMDSDLPIYGTRTLQDVVDQRLGGRRFSIALLMVFAGMAVFLGAIGIYGVMSYAVAQRTREMGVRLALGAERQDVLGLVLKHGAQLTVLGLLVGLVGAAGATRLVSDQLFEVGTADPLTYVTVALVLGGVAMLASWVPARRASSTDPLEALRHE